MIIKKDTCKLALVQAAPVMFDKDKCVEKIIALIGEAAAKGAELIVFPELFIPGYPYGMTYGLLSEAAAGREERTGRLTMTIRSWRMERRCRVSLTARRNIRYM